MAFKMKAGKEGPMRKNFGKDIAPMNFNAGLRKASREGKLDNNPKFKAAVDKAPVKIKKDDKPTGPNTQPPKQLTPEQIKIQGDKLKKIMDKGKVKKIITDVNQGVIGAVKRKKSPKKFIGKAIKGVKKFAQKNPGAATAIGALAAGPIGAIAARRLSKTKLHKGTDRSNQKIV